MKQKRWLQSLAELVELLKQMNTELREAIKNWKEFQEVSQDSGSMTTEEENEAFAQLEQAKNNLENVGKE